MDNLAVPTGARNPENAKPFPRFMLKPENSAMSANFTPYASAITGSEAYRDAAMKSAPEFKPPGDLGIVLPRPVRSRPSS